MKQSVRTSSILTLTCVFSVIATNKAQAQSQNWWRTNGNNGIGVNAFVGTTDNNTLNFRTNNINRIGISGSGDVTFHGLAGNGIGLIQHDANGKLVSLPMTGLGDKVLMDNGQFVPISNFNTGWTLSGNKTLSNVPYVGINTNNPTEALTVNGNALVYGTLTTNGLNVLHKIEADTIKSGVRMNVNGTLVLGEDGGYNGIASRNDELRLNSKPGLDRNVIISANNNGNVGIGVVNPQEKLELAGNAKVYGDLILPQVSNADEQGTNNFLYIDQNGRIVRGPLLTGAEFIGYELACSNNGTPIWQSEQGYLFTGSQPGCEANVGINTGTPLQALDVRGSGLFSQYLAIGTNINTDTRFYIENTTVAKDYLRFANPDGIQFKVTHNGYVTARDVRVTLNAIPDYVFKPDYALPTLAQQAAHIEEKGHLLNVPSEQEMQVQQIGLGELEMINLRLNEEQMLYIIQLGKRLDALEAENKALRNQVEKLAK